MFYIIFVFQYDLRRNFFLYRVKTQPTHKQEQQQLLSIHLKHLLQIQMVAVYARKVVRLGRHVHCMWFYSRVLSFTYVDGSPMLLLLLSSLSSLSLLSSSFPAVYIQIRDEFLNCSTGFLYNTPILSLNRFINNKIYSNDLHKRQSMFEQFVYQIFYFIYSKIMTTTFIFYFIFFCFGEFLLDFHLSSYFLRKLKSLMNS